MAQPNPFEEQVQANLPSLDARPEFEGERLWLTFYLMGPPGHLHRIADTLDESDWKSVDGWEGGFLYPKVQTANSVSSIVEIATRMQELCAEQGQKSSTSTRTQCRT